jgi:hypothetical protein
MIYCGYDSGSESYFGKVLVPGPAPVPVPVPYTDLLGTVFKQQKVCTNLAFVMLEAAMFPRRLASNFYFLFCFKF